MTQTAFAQTLRSRATPQAVELLAHRGLWKERGDRNTPEALEAAFLAGYGVETDLRDFHREIVIAHDMPTAPELTLREMLNLQTRAGTTGTLALNVKADGLAIATGDLLHRFGIENYFAFDMSVPDMLQWARLGLRFFTRQSEYEPTPALYDQAAGVWLDGFDGCWFTRETIEDHLRAGKDVCVVSPELHGRDPSAVWRLVSEVRTAGTGKLLLCTDWPNQWTEQLA